MIDQCGDAGNASAPKEVAGDAAAATLSTPYSLATTYDDDGTGGGDQQHKQQQQQQQQQLASQVVDSNIGGSCCCSGTNPDEFSYSTLMETTAASSSSPRRQQHDQIQQPPSLLPPPISRTSTCSSAEDGLDGVKVVRTGGGVGGGLHRNSRHLRLISLGRTGMSGDDAPNIRGSSFLRHPNNVREWVQQQLGLHVAETRLYKRAVLILIALCLVFLGIRTGDYWTPEQNEKHNLILKGFLIVFTIESTINVLYYQTYLITERRGWAVLADIGIITASWFVNPTLLVLRSFQLIRAMRRATCCVNSEMRHLANTLSKALPSILALSTIAAIIFYSFAVLCTDLFGSLYHENGDYNDDNEMVLDENYFGRLDKTAFTLFQLMTLDGWSTVVKQVMAVYPWAWTLFLFFIIVATFGFGALLVAVMCESMSIANSERIRKSLQMDNADAISTTGKPKSNVDYFDYSSQTTPPIFIGGIQHQRKHRPDSMMGATVASSATSLVPEQQQQQQQTYQQLTLLEKKVDELTVAIERLTRQQST